MSILVDSLRVAAFGGIRHSLALDFSAPLTLIYAPNGTGKTSIIESVDWLFGCDVRDARCKLAKEPEATEVTMSALVAEKALSARRSMRGGKMSRMINGVSVGEAEFLQALSPGCDVSELVPLARIPKLRSYLSGNRVLGVDSLSRLIDSENADSRADAMADLAGTRAQRNAQKMIALYRKRLQESVAKLRDQLEALRKKEQDYLDLAQGGIDVEAQIAEALRILSSTGVEVDGDYASLTVYATRENELTESRLQVLERLRTLLGSRPATYDEHDGKNLITGLESEISA